MKSSSRPTYPVLTSRALPIALLLLQSSIFIKYVLIVPYILLFLFYLHTVKDQGLVLRPCCVREKWKQIKKRK
jgi:hypothetical protein